jgi:restriction endonuclease S subunit
MINKQSLSELPIDLPPLVKQEEIVAVVNAAWREQKLLKQIADKRGKFSDDWLMRLVQGSL